MGKKNIGQKFKRAIRGTKQTLESLKIRNQLIEKMARNYTRIKAKQRNQPINEVEDGILAYDKKEFYSKFNEMNKQEQDKAISRYLERKPKLKQEVEELRVKHKIAMGLGVLGIAAIASIGAGTINYVQAQEQAKQIESIKELGEDLESLTTNMQIEEKIQEIAENAWRGIVAEEIENIDSEKDVHEHLKQQVLEIYNNAHKEQQITQEDLQVLYSNKVLEVKRDQFNNVVGYRESINPTGETTRQEGYIFMVDREKQAFYLKDGTPVESYEYKNADPCFKDIFPLLEPAKRLREVYRWGDNENVKQEAKENYKKAVIEFKEEQMQKENLEKDKEQIELG